MHSVHFSSQTTEWETPADLFEAYNNIFSFTLDAAASHQNAKVPNYFTQEDDALSQTWRGVVWLNPQYGRQIGKWVRKAYESALAGATVVCLVPARTDTTWWHKYAMCGEITFLKGRIRFIRKDGKTGRAPFPAAVVVFRNGIMKMV